MIYVVPGDNFEATLSGAPTGLTGTLGVRILDNAGGTTLARQTSGISEFPAGSGFYAVTLAAPTDTGQYTVMWDTGTVSPSTTFTDDLVVSGTPFGSGASSASAPFISAQDLVDYLGRSPTAGTADPGLLIAVDAACDTVRTIAEQNFNQVIGATFTLDGTGTDAIMLPQLPVTAAGTVTVNGGTITDYTLNGNGIIFRGTAGCDPRPVWPSGRQNVQVTADVGYADADLPRDVRMVALSLASRLVVQGVAQQESVGEVSLNYGMHATDLTTNELRILRKYRQTR
jgi:hypothetical protein